MPNDYRTYYPILHKTQLFHEFSVAQLDTLLDCFAPPVRQYDKGDILLINGYESSAIGIVLAGRICATRVDADGNELLISSMEAGGIYGDVLCGGHLQSPVTVTAATHTTVMLLPVQKLIHPCAMCHDCHSALLQNWVSSISEKYFELSRRLELLNAKNLRQKVTMYLHMQSKGKKEFDIPVNRNEMAAYLCCERSALSRELSRMQAEGLCRCRKNHFVLL